MKIKVSDERKPLVGIVGEIYARSNHFCNDEIIKSIESYGGEAWLSPITEWIHYLDFINKTRAGNKFNIISA